MHVLLVSAEEHEASRLRLLVGADFTIDRAAPNQLLERLADVTRYELVIAGSLPPAWLAAATALRHVVIPFAGVPLRFREALASYPELAVYSSHYNAAFTAEHAWALLLAAAKRIVPADRALRQNDWSMRYDGFPSVLLHGRTLLLLGYGEIGRCLGRMGKAFGMRVWAVKRTPGQAPEIDRLALPADLSHLLPDVDAIVLTLPETAATTGLLNDDAFARMKDGVLLVNVGRGPAIEEAAFHRALRSGKIGAAGIDTWWVYPKGRAEAQSTAPSRESLAEFDNVVLSPHRASDIEGHDDAQWESVASMLRAIAAGEPIRQVDRAEWY